MVRQIIYPTSNEYTLNLPDELLGKEVEILAFELKTEGGNIRNSLYEYEGKYSSVNRSENEDAYLKKGLDDFYSNFQLDLSNYKFNRDEANER